MFSVITISHRQPHATLHCVVAGNSPEYRLADNTFHLDYPSVSQWGGIDDTRWTHPDTISHSVHAYIPYSVRGCTHPD